MSDQRFKKNITPISSALAKVEQLRGVSFRWRAGELAGQGFPKGRKVGFIAQEVARVLPEVVTTDENGYQSVEYANLTALLAGAIRELKAEQDAEIADLEAENDKLRLRLEALEAR